MRSRTWVVTIAAGLVLADASIVTLALPELLRALDTTVEGVAAVIAVYTAVLALALLPAERLVRRYGAGAAGTLGFALFTAASVVCAAAEALPVLLVGRGLQAAGGAAGLVAAFELIQGGTPVGRRHWLGAAVLASAVGPALGGALTQAFDWRAIFVVQIPIAAAGALAAYAGRVPRTTGIEGEGAGATQAGAAPSAGAGNADRAGGAGEDDFATPLAKSPRAATGPARHGAGAQRVGDQLALALVSAALTAVLFGLVLLLIAGWAIEPLAAAATVTILPLAALAGARVGGPPRGRAITGSLLVGGGVLALGWLPSASVAWTFAPQALAGIGMGMALPAFAGELLPERTAHDAARLLTVRHVGIALVLVALAPLLAHRLDVVTERAQEEGVALVLDARLPPQDKLSLAPALLGGVEAERPRAGLEQALADHGTGYEGQERATYDALAQRADDVLVSAVGDAFRIAFVLAGALAMLGAAALALSPRAPVPWRADPDARSAGSASAPGGAAAGSAGSASAPGGAAAGSAGSASAPRAASLGLVAAAVLAVGLPLAYAAIHAADAPAQVAIADPCEERELPGTGGISGFLQDRALEALDAAACRFGSSREELVLALADAQAARRFDARHGVDPRSVGSLLQGLVNP